MPFLTWKAEILAILSGALSRLRKDIFGSKSLPLQIAVLGKAQPFQEGLEVVQPEPYQVSQNAYPVLQNWTDNSAPKYPEQTYYAPTETIPPTKPAWYRRKLYIIIGIVLAVIVVAAIVGGVVGGLAHHATGFIATPTQTDLPSVASSSSVPGPLPTSNSQISVCHGGVCPRILSTVTWPSASFIFGLSSNRSLVYKSWNGNAWDAAWTDLGGIFIFPPTVVSWGAGRLDALGVQTDKALHWRSFSGGAWSATWASLGGQWSTAVNAVSRALGYIDAFGVGTDGALYTAAGAPPAGGPVDETQWAPLEGLDGGCLGPPSVASWGAQRLDVFVRGTDNALWQMWWDGQWHSWYSLGGILTAEPVVVAAQNNQLDIFVLGTQASFCWKGWRNSWLDWQCPDNGMVFESLPAPLVLSQSTIDVVVVANDDHAYQKSLVGATWGSTWSDLGGPLNGAPQVVSLATDESSVFGLGLNGQMYVANWSAAGTSWTGSASWISLGGSFQTVI